MQSPRVPHMHALHQVLQYLKQAPGQGLFFPRNTSLKLTAYSDADWANCVDTRRSITGFAVFLGDALISWKPKKQFTVSKSSTEAEYNAVFSTSSEVVWLQRLLQHFEVQIPLVLLFCDNMSAIHLSNNPALHERSKHIDVDYHYIRELVQTGIIKLVHVKSQHQLADTFTKALAPSTFHQFIIKLGLLDMYAPT